MFCFLWVLVKVTFCRFLSVTILKFRMIDRKNLFFSKESSKAFFSVYFRSVEVCVLLMGQQYMHT